MAVNNFALSRAQPVSWFAIQVVLITPNAKSSSLHMEMGVELLKHKRGDANREPRHGSSSLVLLKFGVVHCT